MEAIIHKMQFPLKRPKRVPEGCKDNPKNLTDLVYFANSLNLKPDNTDFHQA
jgi:hypothetical protein